MHHISSSFPRIRDGLLLHSNLAGSKAQFYGHDLGPQVSSALSRFSYLLNFCSTYIYSASLTAVHSEFTMSVCSLRKTLDLVFLCCIPLGELSSSCCEAMPIKLLDTVCAKQFHADIGAWNIFEFNMYPAPGQRSWWPPSRQGQSMSTAAPRNAQVQKTYTIYSVPLACESPRSIYLAQYIPQDYNFDTEIDPVPRSPRLCVSFERIMQVEDIRLKVCYFEIFEFSTISFYLAFHRLGALCSRPLLHPCLGDLGME